MDRLVGLLLHRKSGLNFPLSGPIRGSGGTGATSSRASCSYSAIKQESRMKLITIAALVALAAAPALADPVAREQAKADYHQAKADAVKSQIQKEDAQTEANAAQADAVGAQVQANAAQA